MATSRGFSLAEMVLSLGLLAMALLGVAAMSVQAKRGGISHRHRLEACGLAHDLLEMQMARSVSDLPLGPITRINGRFQDQTAYQVEVESSSLVGSGPAYTGLTDQDIRRLSVQVRWRDLNGSRVAQAQGVLARVPK